MSETTNQHGAGRRVGILAFEAMEVLDYAGPYEVFNVAGEVTEDAFTVETLALRPGNVAARGGFTVVPDTTYDATTLPAVVIVPGGNGTRALLKEPDLLAWLRDAAATVEVLASVCTGSLVLAAAGLLDDRSATTHHMAFDALAELSPTTQIVDDQRFVRAHDNLWTSGGISAGIDMSLAILATLVGEPTRDQVVEVMEWGWHPRG